MVDSVGDLEKSVKSGDSTKVKDSLQKFITECKDPLSEWLDSKYCHTVSDNSIFTSLPRHWEQEFHKDMDELNVSSMYIRYFALLTVLYFHNDEIVPTL